MKVEVITLFPGFFEGVFGQSILRRAQEAGALEPCIHDLREFTTDRHGQADDYRYGGGPGMLLRPEPLFGAFERILSKAESRPLVIYPTPQGEPFTQAAADELARQRHLVFLCGHYKGVDQRVVERWVDREYSIGDYVLTGGETAVAVMVDAAVRLIPGVLGDADSARSDSFRSGGLDGPHYTRPDVTRGLRVPGVLVSGHHRNIERWRRATARYLTRRRRPDLIDNKSG